MDRGAWRATVRGIAELDMTLLPLNNNAPSTCIQATSFSTEATEMWPSATEEINFHFI